MARVFIALVFVAVLLSGYQAAVLEFDAIDFMHADDGMSQDQCKTLPEGMLCCSGHH